MKKAKTEYSGEWKEFRKGILKMHPSPNKLLYKHLATGRVVKYVYHHSWSREGWEKTKLVKADYNIIKKANRVWEEKERSN